MLCWTIFCTSKAENYIAIVTKTEKIIALQNRKSRESNRPADRSLRVHKSYIISISNIRSIEHNRIFLEGTVTPIRKPFKNHFVPITETIKFELFTKTGYGQHSADLQSGED